MRKKVPLFAVLFFLLPVCAFAQRISINEFMPRPRTGEAEWVELCNVSDAPLQLEGWSIEDRTGKRISFGDIPPTLPPGGYLVLTQKLPVGSRWEIPADSVLLVPSFPSLNNSGDDIVVRDGDGRVADSITYTSSWVDDAGLSIERIDAYAAAIRENWTTCLADSGATPGSVNSCTGGSSGSLAAGQLCINEIMYDPLPTGCEWIEIFHRGNEDVDFSRIEIVVSAGSGFDVYRLPASAGILSSGSYAVIAADSSLLTRFSVPTADTATLLLCVLNRSGLGFGNNGDRIFLRERGGETLDSMNYEPDWHHPFLAETRGISLERIYPELPAADRKSWSSSTDHSGATPGRRNSVDASSWKDTAESAPALTVTPVPFSPDGDGYEDFCTISCMAPASIHQARLRIYDIRGRLVRTLLNNAPMASRIDVVWDGLDEDGNRVRIGPYVALLDILDTADNAVAAAKGIIVVAVRL